MATEKRLHKFNQVLNLESLNNYYKIKKKSVLERVNVETYRILKGLNLPISLKTLIVEKFMNFWSTFNPGSKFRNFEILMPMAIYFVLKSQKFPFNKIELLKISKISNNEFNALKQILQKQIN
ncbi:MAG: hypothetical protein ACFFDK_03645 [Promethearchaeota archaeon]